MPIPTKHLAVRKDPETVRHIPDSTVRRLSLYLRFLEEFGHSGVATVSSGELADRGATTAAQVRKDLSHFGSFGKRGLGYSVSELTGVLRDILGLGMGWRVALVGAGRIGTALFEYEPFRERGFGFVSVFDNDPKKAGTLLGTVEVQSDRHLESALKRDRIDLVVLAVPSVAAQPVLDRVVEAGVTAVLNYAPTQLRVPPGVALRNVSMLLELEGLSYELTSRRE